MTAKELFEKYPKSGEVIVKYYTDVFMNSLNTEDITEEFKELAKTQMLDNEYIQSFIDSNPRGTFDVFDANDINIIIHAYTEEPPTEFGYSIPQEGDKSATMTIYQTRKEAEEAAVERAFEILNEKLCQTK
jgi:hypothetical protein